MDVDSQECRMLSRSNQRDLCTYWYYIKHCARTCSILGGIPCRELTRNRQQTPRCTTDGSCPLMLYYLLMAQWHRSSVCSRSLLDLKVFCQSATWSVCFSCIPLLSIWRIFTCFVWKRFGCVRQDMTALVAKVSRTPFGAKTHFLWGFDVFWFEDVA